MGPARKAVSALRASQSAGGTRPFHGHTKRIRGSDRRADAALSESAGRRGLAPAAPLLPPTAHRYNAPASREECGKREETARGSLPSSEVSGLVESHAALSSASSRHAAPCVLAQLCAEGIAREVPVFGSVGGLWVTGVVDEMRCAGPPTERADALRRTLDGSLRAGRGCEQLAAPP
jgi:hypothetical protein